MALARTVLLFVFFAAGACKTTPVAGECPDNSKVPCMTRRVCSEDRTRGCQTCMCEPALGSPDEEAGRKAGQPETP